MSYRRILVPGLVLLAVGATGILLLSGLGTSQAVQNPSISLDMVPAGTSYDDATNTMTVGTVDSCLTSPTANPATHLHTAHLVIQNVEDLVGWQARMNYIGDQFRPSTVGFTPFLDSNTAQNVSFVNLPIDQTTLVHRDVVFATDIPAQAAGPQTALVGSVYLGAQNFPISPDTPAKAIPDDTSYSAPSGGVLASINLQVVGDESGQASLFINLDDDSPNPPGSRAIVFTGTGMTGTLDINLTPAQLGDGYHGEGATCVPLDCVNNECPGATVTPSPTPPPPTPTPAPVAGHDARLTRISGVPKNVRLSPGEVITDSASVVVANESNHTETIGVYVDVLAPSGCTPNGRVLQTTVSLAAGNKTTVPVPVSYSCSNGGAANGQSYTWTAVADHGADDLASCGPGSLQGLTCFNALANDDEDPADNRKSRTGPKVIAQ